MFGPQPGPQTESLIRPEQEILYGGAKYGGKSFGGRLFILKGNPDRDQKYLVNQSYCYHPKYRALVLRQSYKDLQDWTSKAIAMFCADELEPLGLRAQWRKGDAAFEWSSGAVLLLDHLGDKNAYMKYQGQEFHRVILEEAAQIPKADMYLNGIYSVCRTVHAELRPQIFLTANPIGPGVRWLKKRFFTDPKTGRKVKPKETIREEVFNPVTGQVDVLTRVFIPATVRDNKLGLAADPQYVARLASLPVHLKRAYLDGDWDAIEGAQYFSDFRAQGPLEGEPVQARHVVESEEAARGPWDRVVAGLDWGFGHRSAFGMAFQSEADQRLYLFDELGVRGVGSYELGMLIARRMMPVLQTMDKPHITIWMSPDAFHKRDSSNTGENLAIVAQFQAGMSSLLGPKAVLVPGEDQVEGDPDTRLQTVQGWRVTIRRAPTARVAGFNYLRDLFSWREPEIHESEVDLHKVKEMLASQDGIDKYFRYLKALREQKEFLNRRQLPKLRILSNCAGTIDQVLEAKVDPDNLEDVLKEDLDPETGLGGDDYLDMLRYLVMGAGKQWVSVPKEEQYRRELTSLREQGYRPDLLIQAVRRLDDEYNKKKGNPVYKVYRRANPRWIRG